MAAARKPSLVLLILDGWGHSEQRQYNAVAACPGDHMRRLAARYPHTLLAASGEAVGLPAGVMGNSEVGHLTIGAGRTMDQAVTLINKTLKEDSFTGNPVLAQACADTLNGSGTLHFLGLCSDASVHSHLDHLEALVRLAAARGVPRVRVHPFTDGRDTSPHSGKGYVTRVASFLAKAHPDAAIATVGGRYFGMDRDQRWERVEKHWRALVLGEGLQAADPVAAVDEAYARGETDEFIRPTVMTGVAHHTIGDGDGVIFFNFRPDRARQMTRALAVAEFDEFHRPRRPALAAYVCMTPYDGTFDLPIAFRSRGPEMVLGRLFSARGLRQVRIAETEKYAHVTYFLNGGVERTYPGEERILVPSPRVATYDLQPEMSALEITEKLLACLHQGETDIVVANFANADMVGHTGNYEATLRACDTVDRCVGRVHEAARATGSLLVVTSDHGNAEQMLSTDSKESLTAHTTNPVPLILAREDLVGRRLADGGGLASILPTILTAMDIDCPGEMDGGSLL
ncbi:MAG: 2,3-bisphosphoglycerate-independent phosphoglycerate mutase [Acidobacteria bacterium]|nr:MAG: 2,3-bisphosphoglycerate-independent phosphoglycerate mutase [Acidobacteriota bacterium]